MIIRPPRNTAKQGARDMPRDQYWRSEVRQILLNLLEKNPDFQASAEKIRKQFPQFKRKNMLTIRGYGSNISIGEWNKTGNWETWLGVSENDDTIRYCREIESLTQKFGLRSEWGPTAIHNLIRQPGMINLREYWWSLSEIMTITLQVEVSPGTKWNDVKKDVLQEAKRQFEATAIPLREQAGFPERDRGPDNLKRDVEILYQRICLGLSASTIWNEGERKKAVGTGLTCESIRDIISRTAKMLEITLS